MNACASILCLVLGASSLGPALAGEPSALSPNPLRSLDKSLLKAFVEAPLFDPTRRRPPPIQAFVPIQQSVAVVEPPPSLRLLGVIHGRRDIALVHRADSQKSEMLSTGDRVGSWRVTVLSVGVRLTDGDRAFDYDLFSKGGATGPTPALPPRDAPPVPRAVTQAP